MSAVLTTKPKTVFCLTYHEITADARVLKEARALKAAGHNVHIFCDWPDGFPRNDEIDGMRVTRFDWLSHDNISADTLKRFFFVDKVSDEVNRRFAPYVESATLVNELNQWFETFIPVEDVPALDPKYYKKFTGRERKIRKLKHKLLRWKIRLKHGSVKAFQKSNRSQFETHAYKLKLLHTETRTRNKSRTQLYQLNSLIFAENLCSLKFDEVPDVIHAHDIYCLPAGVVLAKQFDAKLIYDAHEYEPARATKNPVDGSNFAEQLEDDCLAFVDHLITVSPSYGRLYSERFKGEISLVFNTPETDREKIETQKRENLTELSVRARADVPANTPLVVFTGGVQSTHRGLDKVLEALVRLPDVHLVAMGPRNTRDDDWFLGIARDLGIEDRIRLLPPVKAIDVPVAISTADAAICPIQDASLSYKYAMPNKLFEAAFAGIPICVSSLPDMQEFVKGLGIGKAMDQTDPLSIAEALQYVLQNSGEFSMSPDTSERLWQSYGWSAQQQKLQELIERI